MNRISYPVRLLIVVIAVLAMGAVVGALGHHDTESVWDKDIRACGYNPDRTYHTGDEIVRPGKVSRIISSDPDRPGEFFQLYTDHGWTRVYCDEQELFAMTGQRYSPR